MILHGFYLALWYTGIVFAGASLVYVIDWIASEEMSRKRSEKKES